MGKKDEVIPRMNKLFGCILIIGLVTISFLCYNSFKTTDNDKLKPPHNKQSAADFFNNHPPNDEETSAHVETKNNENPKPYLIDVEGLDYLFELRNLSQRESKPLLVWDFMKELLSRSDPLPETAQGIKEASIVFKQLLSAIHNQEEEKEKLRFNSNHGLKDCPYLVSALDKTTAFASGDDVFLQIPCGLIEDSSITVIGIPDEGHGSFRIELVGSQLANETNPLVVLYYDVHMPGDNVTEEPVIVQTTWTNELGWGKEERCPDHGSSNATKGGGRGGALGLGALCFCFL